MTICLFVSDLHGHIDRYEKLLSRIEQTTPAVVFLGGDLMPSSLQDLASLPHMRMDFVQDFLVTKFSRLRRAMGSLYPRMLLILGNDDSRSDEPAILDFAEAGLCEYIHNRHVQVQDWDVYGYGFIPPSPLLIKDWERYDVSRYVDPGSVSPEEGWSSVPRTEYESKYSTIQKDLEALVGTADCSRAVFLFHAPPYQSMLDRASLDGKLIDHVPFDVHVGSIAIKRFIETRQPLITLHGHVHESAALTGCWKERFGRTYAFSAAHDGPELALVTFDLENPAEVTRELL